MRRWLKTRGVVAHLVTPGLEISRNNWRDSARRILADMLALWLACVEPWAFPCLKKIYLHWKIDSNQNLITTQQLYPVQASKLKIRDPASLEQHAGLEERIPSEVIARVMQRDG